MAVAGRARHWRSIGAATTFLLAALAGVAGNQLTGKLTPALAVFAVLIVVGMLVTFAVDRQARERGSDAEADGRPACGQGGFVDMRGARGVQVGEQNQQQNYFGPKSGSGHSE